MLYCVGRYHPVPGENEDLPPGYDLTAAELEELGTLEGVPITLEHVGITSAVSLLLNSNKEVAGYNVGVVLDALCADNIANVPVGVCLDVSSCESGYYVLYAIDTEEWPVLSSLLLHMTGISLSHMEYGNKLVPLELSLCVKPARPGCYQVYSSADYVKALQYMRTNFSSTEDRMAEPSQIEQILARLPDADQKIISARFETMVMEIQKQRKEAQEAIENAKKLEQAQTSGNMKLLQWGIKNIERQLPQAVQDNFNCGSDQIMPELASSDPEAVRRAVDRLICACSHHMMQMASSRTPVEEPVVRKRPRSPSPAPVPAAEATLPSREPTSEELLKEAMANSFGPFTTN